MGSVSNPVHQRESGTIPRILGKMVFNDHPISRYPSGLPEELLRIIGMMEDIDEGNDIERTVVIRDCAPIEGSNWNSWVSGRTRISIPSTLRSDRLSLQE